MLEWYNIFLKEPSLIYVGSKETTVKNLQDLATKLEESSGCQSHFHVFLDAEHAKIYWSVNLVAPVIKKFIEAISTSA